MYFATDARYSASETYSPSDHRGHKHIYYARVLTGEFTVGDPSLKEPPQKDDESQYDSVANSTHNPSMFVIFNDAAVYPDYLIEFTSMMLY